MLHVAVEKIHKQNKMITYGTSKKLHIKNEEVSYLERQDFKNPALIG